MLWWGLRNGRSRSRPGSRAPQAEWIAVLSSASAGSRGGQDPGKPAREHGLAGPGRAAQQEVVAARGGDLERAPAEHLPAHVGEVRRAAFGRRLRARGPRRRRPVGASRQGHGLGQRLDGIDAHAVHDRGLAGVCGRDERGGHAVPARHQHHRQHAVHGADLAVERELADEQDVRERRRRQGAVGGEQPHGGGQVVGRARLAQAGRAPGSP